jgi:hypothetical protein
MPKGLKRPRDPAQLAKLMIDIASGEVEDREPEPPLDGKDAAAVSLGRRGGLKGGKARASKMTPERREGQQIGQGFSSRLFYLFEHLNAARRATSFCDAMQGQGGNQFS